MTLDEFNILEREAAAKLLFSCCGSLHWVQLVMKELPFASEKKLISRATEIWYNECGAEDWKQSFTHHPRIGDIKSLTEKFAGKEQENIVKASEATIEALAKANETYEQKFEFIFIICATGKTAAEMLQLLQNRLGNTAADELHIAMGEQHKITLIRFKKLFADTNFQFLKMSQLTTHVLDTSAGIAVKGISVNLLHWAGDDWHKVAHGITNGDGRIGDLLPPEKLLSAGMYKLIFGTGDYYENKNIKTFYPEVEIVFSITDGSHYHVPLLINPFGYSTYRGT
jgi:5-hydroxyisourate hydrolase / 2-oxo-4-hydroxy-4-carboxy-5-ureidoimidazoline decarboxylase